MILHLLFVVDIFSTLVVADRAKPGPTNPVRMVRWIAGVVVLALLVPTGLYVAGIPARQERQRVDQRGSDAMSALPGVARVTGKKVQLAPGVTFAQAHAIALEGYTRQDNTSPADSARWTLTYGSAQHVLKGDQVQDVSLQTLVILGPVVLNDALDLNITSGKLVTRGQPIDSGPVVAFAQIQDLTPSDGKRFTEAAATVIRVLAVADPKPAARVRSVQGNRWNVIGKRVRSATTAAQLDALGAILSDDVTLDGLVLEPATSRVTLTTKNPAQIAATCQLGLTTLADYPGLTLTVHSRSRSARDAQTC